jgi:predicted PurR-regulated permease PerM
MNPTAPAPSQTPGQRLDPKYTPVLVPAVMAVAMSFVMSLVQTTVRLGFVPKLASAWLTSFAIGVVVAVPTAILVAPPARRLVGRLTGPSPDHR